MTDSATKTEQPVCDPADCSVDRDYHGEPIPADETPETMIWVWAIEPALDTAYDYVVIRDYHKAVEYGQRVVESLMDDPDQEFPVAITIRNERMTAGDYQEILDQDY